MNRAVWYLLIRPRRSQLVPPERHRQSLEIAQHSGAGLILQEDQGLGLSSRTDLVPSPSAGEQARGTSPLQRGLSPTSPLSLLPAFHSHLGETKEAPASQVEPNGDRKPAITATQTHLPMASGALSTRVGAPPGGSRSPRGSLGRRHTSQGGFSSPLTTGPGELQQGFCSMGSPVPTEPPCPQAPPTRPRAPVQQEASQ